MPITFPKAPRAAAAKLVGHLTELARERKLPHRMPQVHLETLSHSEAHGVYFVPLDALAEGKLLAAAKQTSWRYLLVQDNEPIAEAELTAGRRGAKGPASRALEFVSLTHGPFAPGTVEALGAAERLPQVASADYELRVLRIPAVYFVALWLHGANDDILIPMGDAPAGLKRNEPYSEAAVIDALRGPAEQARRFDAAYQERKSTRLERGSKRRGRKK
jgi:hypothetical protein